MEIAINSRINPAVETGRALSCNSMSPSTDDVATKESRRGTPRLYNATKHFPVSILLLFKYNFEYQTAITVCEKKSLRGDELTQAAIAHGLLPDGQKLPSGVAENVELPEFPNEIIKGVYEALRYNRKLKYAQLQDNLGIAESTVQRAIGWLKDNGYINNDRPKVRGVWQLNDEKPSRLTENIVASAQK